MLYANWIYFHRITIEDSEQTIDLLQSIFSLQKPDDDVNLRFHSILHVPCLRTLKLSGSNPAFQKLGASGSGEAQQRTGAASPFQW